MLCHRLRMRPLKAVHPVMIQESNIEWHWCYGEVHLVHINVMEEMEHETEKRAAVRRMDTSTNNTYTPSKKTCTKSVYRGEQWSAPVQGTTTLTTTNTTDHFCHRIYNVLRSQFRPAACAVRHRWNMFVHTSFRFENKLFSVYFSEVLHEKSLRRWE